MPPDHQVHIKSIKPRRDSQWIAMKCAAGTWARDGENTTQGRRLTPSSTTKHESLDPRVKFHVRIALKTVAQRNRTCSLWPNAADQIQNKSRRFYGSALHWHHANLPPSSNRRETHETSQPFYSCSQVGWTKFPSSRSLKAKMARCLRFQSRTPWGLAPKVWRF